MSNKTVAEVGSRLRFASEDWQIIAKPSNKVILRSSGGKEIESSWLSIIQAPDFKMLDSQENPMPPQHYFFEAIPESLKKLAFERERHIKEILTGYQTTDGIFNPDYDPDIPLKERISKKSKELKDRKDSTYLSESRLKQLIKSYKEKGLFGLIDQRKTRIKQNHLPEDWLVIRAIEKVASSQSRKTDVSFKELKRLIEDRLKKSGCLLNQEEPITQGKTHMPGDTKLRELINFTAPELFLSAKTRDSMASRLSHRPFGVAGAVRPGEIVVLDFTVFDFLCISEIDGSTIRLRLLIAQDLFSRAILAWDLIENEPQGIDATRLVLQVLFPKLRHPSWPSSTKWHYTGVPETFVLSLSGLSEAEELANIMPMVPETILVDNGKIFISQQMTDLADRFGFNFIYARVWKGNDKATIENLFRRIRERFAEFIEGYIGSNIQHRGKEVTPLHTRSELMEMLGEFIIYEYNDRSHSSCYYPTRPKTKLSPNQMLELGVSMQGFLYVPSSRNAYYESLSTKTVALIQENGVTINRRRYDGPEFNPYRTVPSPYGFLNNRWPFLYDQRDPSYIFFRDPYPPPGEEGDFHAIPAVDLDYLILPFSDQKLKQAQKSFSDHGHNNHEVIESRTKERRRRYKDSIKNRKMTSKKDRGKASETLFDKSTRSDRTFQSRKRAAETDRIKNNIYIQNQSITSIRKNRSETPEDHKVYTLDLEEM